jgi:hypothetical protein
MPANVFAPQDDRPTVVLVHGAFAGFILEPGESTGELAARFPGGELGPALAPIPYVAGAESGDDL